jgi:glycosyltransferase involved in cell wall biosynthesis
MITHNHELYIEKAINGVLIQNVNFKIELVIGEDDSSDNTRLICERYASSYPEMIRLLPKEQRLGMSKNFLQTIQCCKGKYITFCEGDDYWIDPFKLQMQVDFLDKNSSFVVSSTRYLLRNHTNDVLTKDDMYKFFNDSNDGFVFQSDSILWHWVTKTLTVLLRKDAIDIESLKRYKLFRDTHLLFHVLQKGDGYCHNVFTGVYNVHEAGVWSLLTTERKAQVSYNVFEELSRLNQTSIVLRNRYLQSLRDYLNVKIENSKQPLFTKSIYAFIWRYFKEIHSFSFLKVTFIRMIKKQLSQWFG